jgi:LmbE family N-acetylglucosaminyl deacetylase
MKVLAVGAHPDDVELGCGATLALFKKKRHKIYVLVLTRGEASGDPKEREKECRLSAKTIGVDEILFGNLQDTKITDGLETIMKIENVIDSVKPDIVFAHSSKDGHQDHRNAGLASLSAARYVKTVLLYESPAAFTEFRPHVFVDVASTFDIKLEALKAFGSQVTKVYFRGNKSRRWLDRSLARKRPRIPYVSNAVEGLARFRGFQAGVELAEAFEVGKLLLEIQKPRASEP